MRIRFDGSFRNGLVFLVGVACCARAPGQTPTFTISPPAITNNYIGPITLTVGNLTHGKTVLIGEYLDANGNGKIDPGENETTQFFVTDGQESVLGGATNINVPGDIDGEANGTITVVLNYPGLNTVLHGIAANYLFRLSDPGNAFNPVTNAFAILPQSASQGVNGTLYANNAPQAYAVVIMGMQHGNGGGGTVTDANGHFSISNAPGSYFLLGSAPGYVGETSGVNIISNAFATVNLTNVPATGYMAGAVLDSGTSNGLPGIFVSAQANNALTFGFTDANGNFAMPAIDDGWQIGVDSDSGLASAAPYGYLAFQNNKLTTNLVSGSLSNLNFSFPRATALIYGRLTDSRSNAIPGALIEASSADFLYESDGATTPAGQYAIGVFSNSWFVGPQNLSSSYLIESTNVPVLKGQAALANIEAQLVTAYLAGKVTDENGNPQTNVSIIVNAVNTNSDFLTPLNQDFTTAGDGTFAIGLYGGLWNLTPECSAAGASGLVPPSVNFAVVDGASQSNILLIEPFATATITGTIVDNQGNPVDATAFASSEVHGTNYDPCGAGGPDTNTFQIAVFPGTWSVGVSGDFSSDSYDNPPNQDVTVTAGGHTNVNFILYPYGQTPPRLSLASHTPAGFFFSVMGDPQQDYSLQVSTNLKTWQSLVTNTAYGGSFVFEDTNISGKARFYRAVLAP